jgi:hypothetical protein
MSVNKDRPHVFVLPEDDANRQLANGFHLHVDFRPRQMMVLPEAGGWTRVLDLFEAVHVAELERHPPRFMILLIDFDNNTNRIAHAKSRIPTALNNRVFVLGSLSEPERLRQSGMGSYEEIGRKMAQDCRDETNETWGQHLLQHNATELDRLREEVRSIFFT